MQSDSAFIEKLLRCFDKVDQNNIKGLLRSTIAEKKFFFNILDNITEGILLINLSGVVTFTNKFAKGLLQRSETEKESPASTVFEDPKLLELIINSIESNHYITNKFCRIILPRQKDLLVSFVPIYAQANSDVELYLVVLHDLDIEKSILNTKRANNIKSLTKLAAGIAHEIGNPLNAIQIYLHLIQQELDSNENENTKKWISIITDETQRLDKIVKNFLKMTRTDIGVLKRSNIKICIENAINFLKPLIDEKKISLKCDIDKNIPDFYFDFDKFYQAILNILKNSIEAIDSLDGTIEISATVKSKHLSIFFKDNGVGIENNKIPMIFDAYYTTKTEGSGLGLMNVYNIISEHNGRIHIDSTKGKGTLIVITVPLEREKLQIPDLSNNVDSEENA